MATVLGRRYLCGSRPAQPWICGGCRGFSSNPIRPAGHSHWATIKHDKSKNDAVKSRERQVLSKEIANLSKYYGPDPKDNPRLALAIANAKRCGMPKSTIENAIARGQGLSTSGAPLESLTIEAMLPGSVAIVVECLTDQKGRALQEIRHIIKDHGGTTTPTSFLFEKKGKIVFEKKPGLSVDDYLERAIDAGATDLDADSDGRLIVFTEHTDTKKVADVLSASTGLKVESADIIWDPNKDTVVTIESEEVLKEVEEALESIREDPSVQEIYTNYTRS
ncbi:hypothetical protein VTO42DRAFT_205 [Malbranchea cinnamomea]